MTRDEILAGVRECLGRVKETDPASIREDSRVIGDLGLDSLDLLDLIFQLEQQFKIRIKPGEIERRARACLGDEPMEHEGVYTLAGLRQLREALPEVPPEELAEGLTTAGLVQRFRVVTFVNLVEALRKESHA